jgi:hypothetical protein
MKRLIGLAILAVAVAVPAHAQSTHPAAGGTTFTTNGSAGSLGGGGGFGGSGGSKLASVPPAHFNVTSASGSQSYEPSTFLSYDQAVAAGKTVLDTPPPTVAEAARQQASAHTEKAKVALVQDDYGRAIIVRR